MLPRWARRHPGSLPALTAFLNRAAAVLVLLYPHEGRWHVFMTVKLPARSAIEHCSFERWEDAGKAPRTSFVQRSGPARGTCVTVPA